MAGRKVALPAQVTRVASDYPAVAQIVFMLGAGGKLVGDNADTAPAGSLFATVDPAMRGVPSPFSADTSHVNVEQLAAARPQLVFLSPGASVIIPQLRKLGIPAVVISAFSGPSSLKAGVSLIGSILGGPAPAKAREYASFYDRAVAKATAATRWVPASERPGVLYNAGSPTITEGKGSIVTAWITEGGGVNVAAEHGVTGVLKSVDLEDAVSWNPDYIVCRDPVTRSQVLSDPRWKTVTAVRSRHVLIDPQGVFVWAVRSAEAALQPLWTAEMLYPRRVSAAEVRQQTSAFYQEFYSYTLSDAQLDKLLGPPLS
ncbi:MAG: ABC transporter substrate-binding protein [Nocardiopsaceae bacterium]|nr:ABC transporter substrate-binding protein [Nocardiopsaceae bacterium]